MKTIIITSMFLLASYYFYQNFIINISLSEPLGIYKIERGVPVQRNSIVAVCLSEQYQEVGLANHYLIPGIRCDGSAPLVKTVIAVPGDAVELKKQEIIVNRKRYSFVTKTTDSSGKLLNVFPRGIYKHVNGYWLIGVNSSSSWDSRYWGELSRAQILFCLRRIV